MKYYLLNYQMSFSEGIFHSFVKPSASPSHFTQNILKISKPLFRLYITTNSTPSYTAILYHRRVPSAKRLTLERTIKFMLTQGTWLWAEHVAAAPQLLGSFYAHYSRAANQISRNFSQYNICRRFIESLCRQASQLQVDL